jgi:hypothetical protein
MPDKRNAQAVSSPKGEKLAESKVSSTGEVCPNFGNDYNLLILNVLKKHLTGGL